MAKKKFYVVWQGRQTGIFDSWEKCREQVFGLKGAKYKSFETLALAKKAFSKSYAEVAGKNSKPVISESRARLIGNPLIPSICVDGAWSTATGMVEYQGVDTKTRKVLFHQGPFEDGTNNIVEFLGLVHGLAFCKQHNLSLPIYSDSKVAMGWVRKKEARTKHAKSPENAKLFELMDRAVSWLHQNQYPNRILKWETKVWGENPADFGRK